MRLRFFHWIIKAWTASYIFNVRGPFFCREVRSFLAGHWYFNSVLIIGQEKLKGPGDDEVSHLAGFQQCQLFDTFLGNSTMNEIQTKPISLLE